MLDGEPARLSDFRGKTVVLNFWASWCPPCRAEMPEFQALWERRGPSGPDDLVVLAVDFLPEDSVAAAANFAREFGLTFPVLFDADGSVARRYRVRGFPATFFIDRRGGRPHHRLRPRLRRPAGDRRRRRRHRGRHARRRLSARRRAPAGAPGV